MSVKVMSLVWDHFPHGGADLLLALALADWANHDGNGIWPSVKSMAEKTRQSERAVQYQLKRMKGCGWLEQVSAGGGRAKSTTYRIPIERIPQGAVGGVQILHPLKRVQGGAERVQPDAGNGAIAVAPEPSGTVKRTVRREGGATPSPVSLAFQAYQAGIKRRYNAEYPPSAKANGQLANVVGRVGKDRVVDVVNHYLGHADPFYGRTKHSLDYLVRDCEKFSLELQATQAGGPAPTKAEVGIEFPDGQRKMLVDDYPAGDPRELARRCFRSYSSLGAMRQARRIYVRQGREQRVYAIEELS